MAGELAVEEGEKGVLGSYSVLTPLSCRGPGDTGFGSRRERGIARDTGDGQGLRGL